MKQFRLTTAAYFQKHSRVVVAVGLVLLLMYAFRWEYFGPTHNLRTNRWTGTTEGITSNGWQRLESR